MIRYQLERIKDMYSGISDPDRLDGIPVVTVAQSDIDWLIEQAERVQELEEENNQLNNEMEGLFQKLEDREPYYSMKCLGLEEQNERYREALELLVKNETLGKDIEAGKIAISYNGMIALKGLGIFNDDEYIVYGVDEVIESVLEESKNE